MKMRGFTLVELMISLAILAGVTVGLAALYGNLVDVTLLERKKAEANTDIAISLTLISRDMMMAGFATPDATRVASLNGTGAGTASDRLFIADGWEIMRDFTDNGCDDGTISETMYVTLSARSAGGGYSARLTIPAPTNTTSMTIDNSNINGTAITTDNDFHPHGSLIIHPGLNLPPQGCRIVSVEGEAPSTITVQERLNRNYPAGSLVVPAICYYIERFENRNWLFRNSSRVIPEVERLEVEYGYDENNDMILADNEWLDSLPLNNYIPARLIAVRVNLGIGESPQFRKKRGMEKIATYTTSVELRN